MQWYVRNFMTVSPDFYFLPFLGFYLWMRQRVQWQCVRWIILLWVTVISLIPSTNLHVLLLWCSPPLGVLHLAAALTFWDVQKPWNLSSWAYSNSKDCGSPPLFPFSCRSGDHSNCVLVMLSHRDIVSLSKGSFSLKSLLHRSLVPPGKWGSDILCFNFPYPVQCSCSSSQSSGCWVLVEDCLLLTTLICAVLQLACILQLVDYCLSRY